MFYPAKAIFFILKQTLHNSSHTMGLLYGTMWQHYARKQGSWHASDMYNMYGVCCDVHLTYNDYDPEAMRENILDVWTHISEFVQMKCNSSTNAIALYFFCLNHSIQFMFIVTNQKLQNSITNLVKGAVRKNCESVSTCTKILGSSGQALMGE